MTVDVMAPGNSGELPTTVFENAAHPFSGDVLHAILREQLAGPWRHRALPPALGRLAKIGSNFFQRFALSVAAWERGNLSGIFPLLTTPSLEATPPSRLEQLHT